jgi:hypothetical protein
MTPKRIQRRRTKGWKMPPNCVSVTRPGKFGNPFKVGQDGDVGVCLKWFRECLERAMRVQPYPAAPNGGSLSNDTMLHFSLMALAIDELRGKDLACFCPLTSPCHADVLLELANK